MLVLRRHRSLQSMSSWAGTRRRSAIAGRRSSRIRQGVRHVFGRFAKDVARGLRIRCDWGPQYIADAWINEVKWLGMTITPSYVGEPECNGVIERFMRTLKEQCLYLHRFQSLAEARRSSASSSRGTTPSGSSSGSAIRRLGRADRGDGGMTMTHTRSLSGVRIDDRGWSAIVISPSGVQETGSGTGIACEWRSRVNERGFYPGKGPRNGIRSWGAT